MGIDCPSRCKRAGLTPKFHRNGYYFRKDDRRYLRRWHCPSCRRSFSMTTGSDTFRMRKRGINERLLGMLASKVTMRRCAILLNVSRQTVARRFLFLAARAWSYVESLAPRDLCQIQFDEMRSSIHTKCKPVSIPVAVCPQSRMFLAFDVVSMPAQPPLHEKSLRKYGPLADDRDLGVANVLKRISTMTKPDCVIETDMDPRYGPHIESHFPSAVHQAHRSSPACETGQGEMKRVGFDPLFAINHDLAMMRDGVSRLVRKTWATSKRLDRLSDHIAIYIWFHNTRLVVGARRHRVRQ